ncbi:MAG: hypothetical protein MN733_36510, partial [Nitrososphaera sp.]|nr:hypothetical protein [Nitrososphaera sp.]
WGIESAACLTPLGIGIATAPTIGPFILGAATTTVCEVAAMFKYANKLNTCKRNLRVCLERCPKSPPTVAAPPPAAPPTGAPAPLVFQPPPQRPFDEEKWQKIYEQLQKAYQPAPPQQKKPEPPKKKGKIIIELSGPATTTPPPVKKSGKIIVKFSNEENRKCVMK